MSENEPPTDPEQPHGEATDDLGPHLLGRVPSEPDARDHKMGEKLKALQDAEAPAPDDSLIDKTFRQAIEEGYFTAWRSMYAVWRWIKDWIKRNPPQPPEPQPEPGPVPPAPPTPDQKVWSLNAQLDQGQTPHCVGFGWSAWGNCEPTLDAFDNDYAHGLYYEIKRTIDHAPEENVPVDQQQGTSVRAGAKAMKNRGRIVEYVFAAPGAQGITEINEWLLNHGSVVMGTVWLRQMFSPDANGYVTVSGADMGGHCWLLLGYDKVADEYSAADNSWGEGWGIKGRFKLRGADFRKLYAYPDTEACAALEVATAA